VSFRSRPAREGAEFLASRDTWFRPVFATGGPDGALYVVDMYRKDIDHPRYIPQARWPTMDFTAGKSRGRIYRIVPTGWERPRGPVNLATVSDDALVAALDHPNGWMRDTAQRLLVERDRREALPLLAARASRAGAPGRIHALWAIEGLGALGADLIARAVTDPDAGVRENALRLAETRVAFAPALADAVLRAAADPEPRVRLGAALASGNLPDARAVDVLAGLASREGADRWMRGAVFSGLAGRVNEFFAAVSARPAGPEARRAVLQDVAQVVGAGQPLERALDLLPLIASPDEPLAWQADALDGLLDGLRTRKMTRDMPSPLLSIVGGETPAAGEARRALGALLARASAAAADPGEIIDVRVAAVALLVHDDWTRSGAQVAALIDPRQPAAVQAAAVRALGQVPAATGALELLVEPARWARFTPEVRDAALASLVGRAAGVRLLLDAIERGRIDAAAIPPARRARLEQHRDGALATRAQGVFARAGGSEDNRDAYARLRPAVQAVTGAATRGAGVFATHCRTCHTFNGQGGTLGPDLSGLGSQPADAILRHVLVPDAEITAGYQGYLVELRDGRTLAGRIESEAPQSLTLHDAASATHTVLRADMSSLTLLPGSLMPAGFDQALSPQGLADLIAYLRAP
jgi:putative heme-binding domain-containing protein